MSMPFYVSPEQVIKDKADYARKGIARGRSVVVLQYAGGLLFVAENRSRALHKISEIYDRIAFAAVGKYNEFESLRRAGIQLADLRGYSYDRADVSGLSLANAYATTLGTVFTEQPKPYEVELCVAEVAKPGRDTPSQLYRIGYDGSVVDETRFLVMGGHTDAITTALAESFEPGLELAAALRVAVDALSTPVSAPAGNGGDATAAPRELTAADLEVAVLDRTRPRRAFRRLGHDEVSTLLDGGRSSKKG